MQLLEQEAVFLRCPLMPEVYFIMRNVLLMYLQPFTTLPHQKQTTALGT